MAKLLYIDSAIGKERSASILEVGKVFLDAYQETHLNDQLETMNVWNAKLEELDEITLEASAAIIAVTQQRRVNEPSSPGTVTRTRLPRSLCAA